MPSPLFPAQDAEYLQTLVNGRQRLAGPKVMGNSLLVRNVAGGLTPWTCLVGLHVSVKHDGGKRAGIDIQDNLVNRPVSMAAYVDKTLPVYWDV